MEKINYQSPMGTLMIVVRGGKIVEISLKTTKNTNDAALQRSLFYRAVRLTLFSPKDSAFAARIPRGQISASRVARMHACPLGINPDLWRPCKMAALRTQKPSMSAQAVGQALSKNPILLMIPCHRIVAKGGIGGFSSGLALKTFLLEHEQ